MFTLKLIDDESTGYIRADDEHQYGGTDLYQIYAFNHLWPYGECPFTHKDILLRLAQAHGWDVEIRVKKQNAESPVNP